MQVRVLFFGALRDLSGHATDSLSLPEGATLADLVSHYEQKIPKLKQFLPSLALSLNQQYAQADSVLHDQDEVALLPPVSGGNSAPEREILPVRGFLTRERIRTDELARALQKPEDGAVVVFEGVVRNNTRGRRTLYLDYEVYEAMAAQELQKLADQACEKFAVREVQIVHRLGTSGDRRDQRGDHCLFGASRSRFRRVPLDYRYTEEDGADLEERVF